MTNKPISSKELLAGGKLRSLSQKNLLSLVENNEKVGVVINDQLSIAMMKWNKYKELINVLADQQNSISELESQLEDVILAVNDSASIQATESGQTKEYPVENLSDAFKMLKQRSKGNDSKESTS